MIIVNLKGGLGNQMFQYALGYVLAKKKNRLPKLLVLVHFAGLPCNLKKIYAF